MRVLYLGGGEFPGGGAAARCMHMTAKGLVAAGHHVTMLFPRAMDVSVPRRDLDGIDVRWSWIPSARSSAGRVGYALQLLRSRPRFWLDLLRLVWTGRYDWIIQYAMGLDLFWPVLWAPRRVGVASSYADIRHVGYVGSRLRYVNQLLGDELSARCSDVILNGGSGLLADHYLLRAPGARLVSVPQPVDVAVFAAGDGGRFRRRHGLEGKRLVAYAGSFRWIEGIEDLGRALGPVMEADPGIRLVLAGAYADQDFAGFHSFAAGSALRTNTVQLGRIPLGEVADMLAAADVLVLPKIDHPLNRHANPIKLVEYFASGRPVVCSAVGGVADYAVHGENALVHLPGDIAEMRRHVVTLLHDADLGRRLGRNAQRLAHAEFDIAAVARRITEVLRDAAPDGPTRAASREPEHV